MADNTTLNTGSGGDTLRTEDRGTFKTPTSLIDVGGQSGESLIGDAGVYMPIEGTAAHDAASAGNPILVGAEFDDTTPDSVDEGDVGKLRMSANRNLYVSIRDAAGAERGLNVDASGQLAVTQGGTWSIQSIGPDAHDAPASGNPVMMAGQFDDTSTDVVDEGDVGRLRITNRRALYTTFETPAGDSPWDDTNDALQVNIVAGGGSGGTSQTDDSAFAVGSDNVTPVGYLADETSSDAVDEGDIGAARMTLTRKAYAVLTDPVNEVNATVRNTGTNDSLNVAIVDASGNQIVSFGGAGGTSHADDAAFSIGSASSITPAGYLADETAPDSVDEGDVGVPRMTLSRKPYAVIADATSEYSAAVDSSGRVSVALAAEYTEGDVDATITGTVLMFEGAANTIVAGTGDATNGLDVDVTRVSGTVTVDGSGVTQPVSGTVTANLSATDNAVLDQIEVNTSYGDQTGGGVEASALRVTIANDSTGLVSVDDNGGSLTIDGSVTANAGTNLNTSALALESGGNLDTIAALSKAEDAVHGSGDTGVMSLAVRNDTLAALAGTDGDYAPLQVTATGAAYVHVTDSSGASVEGATQYTETDTDATISGMAMMMEGAADTLYPAQGDATDGLLVNLGANNDVTGTVTANLSATDNAVLDQIEVNTSYGDQTGGGVEASALRVTIASDSTGVLTVDNAGTFAMQEDGAALTALQLIDDSVFADDAAFTLASSKVMMVGAIRDDSLSTLTAVEGDAVPFRVNSTGALHVTGAGGGTQYQVDDAAGATDTGTLSLAIRDDSLTTLTPIDGDYVGLRVNSTGALHVTGGGGGTEYVADAAAPATPTGTASLMERDDALGGLTPIEGDWSHQFCSANGALWVSQADSGGHTPDFTSTGESYGLSFSTDGTKANATYAVTDVSKRVIISGQTANDSIFSGNPVVIGGVMDETATDTVDEGDAGNLRITSRRALYTTFETPAGDSPWDDTNDALQVNVVAGAASGTEYTEDAVAPANPAGPAVALVRQDTPGAIATTDGDIVAQRATNYGAAYVQILDSSGNFINTFGGSGGTSATDDTAFAAGSGTGTPAMGFFSTDTVDAGDSGVLAMDASRRLMVSIEADNVGIGGGTQYTEGDTDATITGTALLYESSDTLVAASGDDTYGLDVDVTRVVPGTAATNLGKAVDSAAGATDTGVAPLAVRDDTLSALTPIDGDYVPLRVSATGALHVTSLGSDYTEGATDATITGKAMMMEGAANTLYPAQGDTTDGLLVNLGANNDVAVTGTVTANLSTTDNNVLDQIEVNTSYGDQTGAGTETGCLRVTLANDSTGTLTVDNAGTFAVQVDAALPAGDNNIGNVDIVTVPAPLSTTGGGTEAAALRVTIASNSTGVLSVDDNGGALTVDNSGTFAVQAAGAVAHDGVDSGNPLKLGAKASNALSGLTLVANNDRTNLYAGLDGVLIVRNHCNLEGIVAGNASNTDGASTSVIAAAGAGIKQYLTSCTITNTSATNTYCEIKSGTTVRWRFPVPANGGVTHTWDPPLPPNAANEAWNFDMGAAVSTAYCSLSGFKSKV